MSFYIGLCVGLMLAGSSFAQCPLGQSWIQVTPTKCMVCGTVAKSYTDAQADCQARDGNLGSILTTSEHDLAKSCSDDLAVANGDVWMGLRMWDFQLLNSSFVFGWLDGSPRSTSVVSGVTAPGAFTDGCFAITTATAWSEVACADTHRYVCSRDIVKCQSLIAPDGSELAHSPSQTPYYPGNVATYSCKLGYNVTGTAATRTCQNNGTWSGQELLCNPVDCGPVEAAAHGHVDSDTTTYNSVATYSCDIGYTLGSSSPTRVCQANATWTGTTPACTAVTCGTLTSPSHGAISTSGTTYGSIVTYSCNDGYDMEGAVTRTCMETGIWSEAAPSCRGEDKTLEIALGAAFGGLALIGIIAAVIYFLTRTSPPGLNPTPYNRSAPYRRRPGYPRPGPPRGPARPPPRPAAGRLY